jgi:hypothetical protein
MLQFHLMAMMAVFYHAKINPIFFTEQIFYETGQNHILTHYDLLPSRIQLFHPLLELPL